MAHFGSMPDRAPSERDATGERQRLPCQGGVVLQHTSCGQREGEIRTGGNVYYKSAGVQTERFSLCTELWRRSDAGLYPRLVGVFRGHDLVDDVWENPAIIQRSFALTVL